MRRIEPGRTTRCRDVVTWVGAVVAAIRAARAAASRSWCAWVLLPLMVVAGATIWGFVTGTGGVVAIFDAAVRTGPAASAVGLAATIVMRVTSETVQTSQVRSREATRTGAAAGLPFRCEDCRPVTLVPRTLSLLPR